MSVHGTHCCPRHGCKYGLDTCTVAMGMEAGLPCEICDSEASETQQVISRILADAENSGPVLKTVAEQFQKDFAVYLCACNPEGLHEALTQALKTVIVTYTQQVLRDGYNIR